MIVPKLASRLALVSAVTSLISTTALAQGRPKLDLSRLVVVGDSLAAGVENGSLVDFQQVHGFAKVIAEQAHARLTLPLVPYPGAPNTLELVSAGFPPVVKPVPGVLLFPRLNPFDQVTNLAVPLQTLDDALNRKPTRNLASTDATQLATDLVLGFPCPILFACDGRSQVDEAVALRPSAILVDIGNNDILGPLTSGQFAALLSSPSAQAAFFANFHYSYLTLLQKLSATGAPIVVGNLPDVIQTAYFIPVPKLAAAFHAPPAEVAALLGITTSDYVTLDALTAVDAILTNQTAGPLPAKCGSGPCVVTAQQAQAARQIVMQLNQNISAAAVYYHAVVVDLFTVVDHLYTKGYPVGGVTLTSDYLGGLFSLDGIHPDNTGYAIMANAFINAINSNFDVNIKPANVRLIALFDPLVLNKPWRR